jgi:hypothetical protein
LPEYAENDLQELKMKRWKEKTNNREEWARAKKKTTSFSSSDHDAACYLLDAYLAYSSTVEMEAVIFFEASTGLHGVTF